MHCRKHEMSYRDQDSGVTVLRERALARTNQSHLPAGFRRRRVATSPVEERATEPNVDLKCSRFENLFVFGPFSLSAAQRLLRNGEETVRIGGRALDLLISLVERPGEVIAHKELIARVWPNVTVEKSNLRFHIAELRKVLGDGLGGARYISNVAGRGYCFVAAVERSNSKRASPQAGQAARLNKETAASGRQADTGFELLRAALQTLHSEQREVFVTLFASALMHGVLTSGQFDEPFLAINKAMSQAAGFGTTSHVAELPRLRAKGLVARKKGGATAVGSRKDSPGVACEQSALADELRSATTLAHLLSESGLQQEARSILAPVYDRFTEEFETDDLRAARALLASLGLGLRSSD